MRVLIWLAAAVLSAIAAGEARAQAKTDISCSVQTKSVGERIEACTRFINRTPLSHTTGPQLAEAYDTRAIARADSSDCAGGIQDINLALAMASKYREPAVRAMHYRYHISAAYIHQTCAGNFDAAIAALGPAIQMRPDVPYGFAARALLFSEKGDFSSAYAEIGTALSVARENQGRAFALVARAAILDRDGRRDETVNILDEAVRLDPSNAFAFAERGNMWRLKGDLSRALTDLNIAVRLNPGEVTFLSRRGEVLRYRGELSASLADFDRALALRPQNVPALTGRGLLHEKLGDRVRARADFDRAIASPVADVIRVREARETARARLAALDTGLSVPVIAPAPAQVTSTTSVPTPSLAAPILNATVVPATKLGRRVALVVGNSAYRRVPELVNPKHDANAIAASLRNVGFDQVMQVADTTREALQDALRRFALEAASADWAMVYYAGHGIEVNGRNYLIPVDAKLAADRDVQAEAVLLDQVIASLEGARKLKLVVLDACRDNPFAPRMQRTLALADTGASVPVVGSIAGTRSIGRGLGEVKVSGASLVVFAAKHGQTALDGEGGNSPFAIALVQRIATPGVEINKIFRLVRDDVMEATAGRQEPYTYGSLPGREDFFFVAAK